MLFNNFLSGKRDLIRPINQIYSVMNIKTAKLEHKLDNNQRAILSFIILLSEGF